MEREYEITETLNVLIPLPDGTHLAANLILPDGAGPAPAIIVYQPYLKDLHGHRHHPAVAAALCPPRLRLPDRRHARYRCLRRGDAAALLTFGARGCLGDAGVGREQPWCNGTTAMWGISYSGSTALAAASMQPPSLRAIVPMHGTANEYWGFLRPHGCRPGWWTEASWGPKMVLLSLLPPLARDPERRWARVWRDRLEQLQPLPFIWHTIPFDQYMGWRTDASRVEAAMYAVSGWHDYYPQATLDYFNAARGPRRVLIGGWKHEFPDIAVIGGIGFRADMDRWWDRWLRGVENGIDREPEVVLWHQGEDAGGTRHHGHPTRHAHDLLRGRWWPAGNEADPPPRNATTIASIRRRDSTSCPGTRKPRSPRCHTTVPRTITAVSATTLIRCARTWRLPAPPRRSSA